MNPEQSNHCSGFDLLGCGQRILVFLDLRWIPLGPNLEEDLMSNITCIQWKTPENTYKCWWEKIGRLKELSTENMNISDTPHIRTGQVSRSLQARPSPTPPCPTCQATPAHQSLSWVIIFPRYLNVNMVFCLFVYLFFQKLTWRNFENCLRTIVP